MTGAEFGSSSLYALLERTNTGNVFRNILPQSARKATGKRSLAEAQH